MRYTALIDKVRAENPLIHNITNNVVINFTANGLIAIGASPVMASAAEEAAQMVRNAQALLLNIGTLSAADAEAMILAGEEANRLGIPVVFDPVGVGATPYRTETALNILERVQVRVIRGNAAEIGVLAGAANQVKGVDSAFRGSSEEIARTAAAKLQTAVIATGKEDIITNGDQTYTVQNGDPMLTAITGSGCLLSAVTAAFLAVESDVLKAGAAALSCYGIAAEQAASYAKAPGSFQVAFLDALYQLSAETAADSEKITKVE